MLSWLRPSMLPRGREDISAMHKKVSINEEYLNAVRTQSYVEFVSKAQLLIREPSTAAKACNNTMEMLLEPDQEVVPSILEAMISPHSVSDLKHIMFSYFDTSADASKICANLLRCINMTHSHYQLIQRTLDGFSDHSPEELKIAISQLGSFTLLSNPFANLNRLEFKLILDRYSLILQHLRSKRKKVARSIKVIECIKKASGICLTVACSVVALVAIGIAVHSLTGLLMGPAIIGISPVHLAKKFLNLRWFHSSSLRKLEEQLNAAAKGTYILNRDFDIMSRLVARLHDEVERIKSMIRFWLEREDKFSLQEVVKELRKNGHGFKRQVDELEEHVCLCLLTINKARVLVTKEMS